jgi:drug/metabolite transporter (DMT)-like permease
MTGLGPAALGVLAFSFSFPATVLALDGLDPYFIGIGRAAAATVLAVLALASVRAPLPRRGQWGGLAAAGAGVVFGFPGLLPGATAVCAVLRAHERPSTSFWLASGAGATCIGAFALSRGAGRITPADLLLFAALLAGAIGYAEGGRLARDMPGWRVISWALVLTGPISIPVTLALLATGDPRWTGKALIGFGYVSVVSMFLGFFAWYSGLGRAGIARASQMQLAQPMLTLGWSALFLGERIDAFTGLAAVAVLGCVAWTQRARSLPVAASPRTLGGSTEAQRCAQVGEAHGRPGHDPRGRLLAGPRDSAAEHLSHGVAGRDGEARGHL